MTLFWNNKYESYIYHLKFLFIPLYSLNISKYSPTTWIYCERTIDDLDWPTFRVCRWNRLVWWNHDVLFETTIRHGHCRSYRSFFTNSVYLEHAVITPKKYTRNACKKQVNSPVLKSDIFWSFVTFCLMIFYTFIYTRGTSHNHYFTAFCSMMDYVRRELWRDFRQQNGVHTPNLQTALGSDGDCRGGRGATRWKITGHYIIFIITRAPRRMRRIMCIRFRFFFYFLFFPPCNVLEIVIRCAHVPTTGCCCCRTVLIWT